MEWISLPSASQNGRTFQNRCVGFVGGPGLNAPGRVVGSKM